MSGYLTPMGDVEEIAPHRCGRCNNSTGILNPACPNAPKPTPAVDGYFTNEEMAALILEWSHA